MDKQALFVLFQGLLISLSGVLAPGPLTAVVIGKGARSPYAGALIGIGHGVVEIPLIILIYLGMSIIFKLEWLQIIIFIIGGIFLGLMAYDMFKSIYTNKVGNKDYRGSSIFAGIALSAGNPYFILWWVTVGVAIITKVATYGKLVLAIFIVLHLSCDVFWYFVLSTLTYNGKRFFGLTFQKVLFVICGVFLSFFSIKFVYEAVIKLL